MVWRGAGRYREPFRGRSRAGRFAAPSRRPARSARRGLEAGGVRDGERWQALVPEGGGFALRPAPVHVEVARDKVLEAMLEMVEIPVPDSLVEAEVHRHLEGEDRLEDDEHRAEVTESTTKAMQTQFLLDALVKRDEVEVDQGELIEYIMMTAQQYGMNAQQFAQQIDQQNQVPAMVAEVGRRKALANVLEQAKVTDTDGNAVDLDAIEGDDEDDEAAEEVGPGDQVVEAGDEVVEAEETEDAAKA